MHQRLPQSGVHAEASCPSLDAAYRNVASPDAGKLKAFTPMRFVTAVFSLLLFGTAPWGAPLYGQEAAQAPVATVTRVINVLAPPYKAKCDGNTDDRAAIQAAFDDAWTHGFSIQFPAGTCKTSTVVWKGQSFFGAGIDQTTILGMPGQDVFQTPDSKSPLRQNAFVHDVRVLVDVSVDASATVNGGNNTFPNRIAGTVQGTTPFDIPISPGPLVFGYQSGCGATTTLSTPTTVTVNCGITNNLTIIDSKRVKGAPITIEGAGPGGANYKGTIIAAGAFTNASTQSITVSPAISTAVTNAKGTMLNPITPPWYLGNAAFALQCSDGNNCSLNTTSWKFQNVLIMPMTGDGSRMQYNHAVGIFTQIALYDGQFDNVSIAYLYGGYIEAAPPIGRIPTADTMVFNKLAVGSAVIPIVTYNGNDRVMNGVSIYASGGIQSTCGFFLVNSQKSTYSTAWNINGFYCEGAGTQSGEIARFMSGPYKVQSANFAVGASPNATIQWLAHGSTWDGFIGANLALSGNGNKFSNTRLLSRQIADTGQDNAFDNAVVSGTNSYMGRRWNPNPRPYRDPIGKFDGSFLVSGNSGTPYLNASDLLTTCDDWSIAINPASTYGSCVTDAGGTELTRRYFQSAGATTVFDLRDNLGAANAWSSAPRVFGIHVPMSKVTVLVHGRCIGAPTCAAAGQLKDATSNATIGNTGALAFTSEWSTQSWPVDLTGATYGDIMGFRLDKWTNSGTKYQIAWIAIQPYPTDVVNTVLRSAGEGGKVPAWLGYYGDGTEGQLNCPSGVCPVAPGEHWYSRCTISAGATLAVTGNQLPGAPLILRCSQDATIAGTVSYAPNTAVSSEITANANFGGGGGGGGGGTVAGMPGGGYNGPAGQGLGGAAGAGEAKPGSLAPGSLQKLLLSQGFSYTEGNACGGSAGGQGGSHGGGGGKGGGCVIVVSPNINFTGTCDVSGAKGSNATSNNAGPGGGGAGGICILRSPNLINKGTFSLGGGAAGSCLSFTGCGAANKGADGWKAIITQ